MKIFFKQIRIRDIYKEMKYNSLNRKEVKIYNSFQQIERSHWTPYTLIKSHEVLTKTNQNLYIHTDMNFNPINKRRQYFY